MEEKALKEEIIALGRRLHELRLAVARGGNLSSRVDKDTMFITATSTSLGQLNEADIIKADVTHPANVEHKRLSTEFPLHRAIYKNFMEANRVIHCHPALTNAYFSVYDDLDVLTFETKLYLGNVPVVKQFTPSITNPQEVIDALKTNNIVAIKNHGVVAVGNTFTDALYLIEGLEEAVRMAGVAMLFKKEVINPFEAELKKDLSIPMPKPVYEMFSPGHIEAIVGLVNKDEFIAQKGAELDLTVELAIKLLEQPEGAYTFCFEKGKIVKVEQRDTAPFVISASGEVWRHVFLGKLDPFVGTIQGKMKLKGELIKLSRWYLPFTRLFALFKEVRIK
ncbi:MAG: class II aldolase/adducin family protein [Pseudomonadota bacterium]